MLFPWYSYYLAEIFSLDILCVCEYFILDAAPVLNFKSPDVATDEVRVGCT